MSPPLDPDATAASPQPIGQVAHLAHRRRSAFSGAKALRDAHAAMLSVPHNAFITVRSKSVSCSCWIMRSIPEGPSLPRRPAFTAVGR
jgi:hypothetical protein